MFRTRKAFSLLELFGILLILSIIAAIVLPSYATVMRRTASQTALVSAESLARNANMMSPFDGFPTSFNGADGELDLAISEVAKVTEATFISDFAGTFTDSHVRQPYGKPNVLVKVTKGGHTGVARVEIVDGEAVASSVS
jgi:Tfp pilus assembly protein PilE